MEYCVDRPLVVTLQKKTSVQDMHYIYHSDFDKSQPVFSLQAYMFGYTLDNLVGNPKFNAKTRDIFSSLKKTKKGCRV